MKKYLAILMRLAAGLLFVYSGGSKLLRPNEYFQMVVGLYQACPEFLIPVVAHAVPWTEYLFGALLLVGLWTEFSAIGLTFLTMIFQIVLAQAVMRDLPIDECGCFGSSTLHITLYQSFALDTALIVFLLFVASQAPTAFSLDRFFNRKSETQRD